jgi:ABC-2 type transport system ATP-binding protein
MNGMEEPTLAIKGLYKTFGSFVAVNDLDLTIAPGQVFGFLGPNGAGKTTTLRLVVGLLRPTSGSMHLCGIDLQRQPIAAKRKIGFISDRPYLYEKLTGGEFLRFVGGLWGMSRKRIEEQGHYWMERFDMQGWLGEPIEAYSHGMRQRLLICSALLHQPALLIMDEPMVGLDPRGASKLKSIVRELAEKYRMSVILSTHTLDVVEQICDTVGIIHHGRIVLSGTLDQIHQFYQAQGGTLEELFLRLTEGQTEEQASAAL